MLTKKEIHEARICDLMTVPARRENGQKQTRNGRSAGQRLISFLLMVPINLINEIGRLEK